MIHALQGVAHEHHDTMLPHVDALAAIADEIGISPASDLAERLAGEQRFLTGQLIPHMERAEQSLHPALERLMQNRHSMTPLRREHEQIRALIAELDGLRAQPMELGVQLRLRRVLYRLYALLKVHLAEEDAYLGVLEHNLSPAEEDELARSMAHALGVAVD